MIDITTSTIQKSTTSKQKLLLGHTYEIGVPKSKLVRVYNRENGVLLASVKSNADGLYKVFVPHGLSYTIVSIDEKRVFNAVVQDNIK
ncbi:hypothetical protein [Acinetobacter johnsonii]|uniref:hypothetical protein n=1 Tax=Acinetobacter johnsonii TaxID=40214 RepID=UPI002446D629|nr:hypothetical protein [Acinetobacter johnsonii]MDH1408021.1 hypothetical protein [Acinetobacter johnsonii]